MKTLLLMRHAKSSWTDPSLSDFERPLNERGRRAAPFMGGVLKREGLIPDHIICSPAKRTKETAELVQAAVELDLDIGNDARIYEATAGELIEVVSEMPETASRALLIGHNPSSEQFVQIITGAIEAMPTAALAVIDLDIGSWAEIAPGKGKLRRLFRPKEEMQ
ncbi:MAG: histidine phosphatase family protein [Acidobacteria bacterium]|nr:histidine phosphatase family protein [Acidobacteriota bacterium]